MSATGDYTFNEERAAGKHLWPPPSPAPERPTVDFAGLCSSGQDAAGCSGLHVIGRRRRVRGLLSHHTTGAAIQSESYVMAVAEGHVSRPVADEVLRFLAFQMSGEIALREMDWPRVLTTRESREGQSVVHRYREVIEVALLRTLRPGNTSETGACNVALAYITSRDVFLACSGAVTGFLYRANTLLPVGEGVNQKGPGPQNGSARIFQAGRPVLELQQANPRNNGQTAHVRLQDDDRFLLCSNSTVNALRQADLDDALAQHHSATTCCEQLIAAAQTREPGQIHTLCLGIFRFDNNPVENTNEHD